MNRFRLSVIAIFFAAFTITSQTRAFANDTVTVYHDSASLPAQAHKVLMAYFAVKDGLVGDNLTKSQAAAKELINSLQLVDTKQLSHSERDTFTLVSKSLREIATKISAASDLETVRDQFISLSDGTLKLVQTFKANNGMIVYSDYCPMKKARWLSSQQSIRNPYYGKSMLTCGSVRQTIH